MNIGEKRLILIVEDDESMRTVLERQLFREGYNVVTAANGRHAIQKMTSGLEVDLILTDVRTPLMDGLTMVEEIRRAGMNTPVIVMTAYADSRLTVAAAKLKVSSLLVKPFQPKDLATKIRGLLPPNSDEEIGRRVSDEDTSAESSHS